MAQPLIDLVNISKSFDNTMVLDDLSLSVKENSFVTLLGPSGCGKTTTLRIIGGFETADTGKVGPLDAGENSLFSLSDPDDAFAPCLGWGPGVSGCSLKSVIAAASLLKWADGCNMSIQPVSDIKGAYTQWFDSLSADDQQSFADAWPLIKADAETLLTDKDSMTGRIEDAGLDAKELPGCSEENWKALADVIDVLVPASSEY